MVTPYIRTGSEGKGGCAWPRDSHLVRTPRADVVQGRSYGRTEFAPGPFSSAGSQKPTRRPALGLARALKETERWHQWRHCDSQSWPERSGPLSGAGMWQKQSSRAKDPEALPGWGPGPVPWSRSAWYPAPHVPRGSPVQIHTPLAVAVPVLLPVSSLPTVPSWERAEGVPSPPSLGLRHRKPHQAPAGRASAPSPAQASVPEPPRAHL